MKTGSNAINHFDWPIDDPKTSSEIGINGLEAEAQKLFADLRMLDDRITSFRASVGFPVPNVACTNPEGPTLVDPNPFARTNEALRDSRGLIATLLNDLEAVSNRVLA